MDTAYYCTPSVSIVKGWAARTLDDFIFSLKVPALSLPTGRDSLGLCSAENATLDKVLPANHKKGAKIYAYANNHYAGHGPATVELFQKLWKKE